MNPMIRCKTDKDQDKNYKYRLCCYGGKDEETEKNLKWMQCRGETDEASKATKECGEKLGFMCDEGGYKGLNRCKVHGDFLQEEWVQCCYEDYGITTYPWGMVESPPTIGL